MSYTFSFPVSTDHRKGCEMLKWAKQNCPSYITNDVEKRHDDWYYRFYFVDKKDCIMFKLRWS